MADVDGHNNEMGSPHPFVYSTWYSPTISMLSKATCDSPNDSMVTLYSKSREVSMSPLNSIQAVAPSVAETKKSTACYHYFQCCCCMGMI
jgi:hypothetical protein